MSEDIIDQVGKIIHFDSFLPYVQLLSISYVWIYSKRNFFGMRFVLPVRRFLEADLYSYILLPEISSNL
jgi:hypothetical protein